MFVYIMPLPIRTHDECKQRNIRTTKHSKKKETHARTHNVFVSLPTTHARFGLHLHELAFSINMLLRLAFTNQNMFVHSMPNKTYTCSKYHISHNNHALNIQSMLWGDALNNKNISSQSKLTAKFISIQFLKVGWMSWGPRNVFKNTSVQFDSCAKEQTSGLRVASFFYVFCFFSFCYLLMLLGGAFGWRSRKNCTRCSCWLSLSYYISFVDLLDFMRVPWFRFVVAILNGIVCIAYRVHCSPAMPNFRRDHVLHNPVSSMQKTKIEETSSTDLLHLVLTKRDQLTNRLSTSASSKGHTAPSSPASVRVGKNKIHIFLHKLIIIILSFKVTK